MELHERLAIFFERLRTAAPVGNADDSVALIGRLIEEVEDEFCRIPRSTPPPKTPTGRMYAPQADSMRRLASGHVRIRTAGHVVICGPDGSLRIENTRKRIVEIIKPGVET